jgi:CheY-like chemotaxis protein
MPRGGQLTIETRSVHIEMQPGGWGEDVAPGHYVQITVRDTGHGMNPEVQARIFEPFFTTKKVGEGTGLGLSMAYGIVHQSGGHIRVQSKPGEGTAFIIYLPAVAAQGLAAQQPLVTGSLPRGSETILLAEDESAVRQLIGAYLQKLGYQVLTASNGLAAIAVARSYPDTIHLLLTDFVMPKMGGPELAEELKKVVPNLKVLFLSGYAGQTVSANSLDVPETRFLSKPVSLDLLGKTIRDLLDSA